jgi:Rps23 Pro-64 3,4-dihydroxylase Tpa1-like proline 4-hydroxylase
MAFAEARTARQAFQMLDTDIDLDEFGKIISDFVRRELRSPERPVDEDRSLQELLNPSVFASAARVDQIGGWLRQARALLVPDALPADLAEAAHRDLHESNHWSVAEGGHDFFHYHNSVILDLEERSPALKACSRLFKSTASRSFIVALSGQDCTGEASVAAAWYRPGEYALPHDNSAANDPRSVANIWYLTRDWQQEWEGALFWCQTGQYICPKFNVLVMFNVVPSNIHLICPVAPIAPEKRLTINGFWSRAERNSPSASISPAAVVSPRMYGPPAPVDEERSPIIVL